MQIGGLQQIEQYVLYEYNTNKRAIRDHIRTMYCTANYKFIIPADTLAKIPLAK